MESISRVRKFISHWYKRYLVSTELYMVEPWERIVIHVLLAILFASFWYFNYKIIGSGITQLLDKKHLEELGDAVN